MNEILHNCRNCGGRVESSADGRVVACRYCGSSSSATVDPHALAAGIAADTRTVHAGFDRLLAIFRETLPAETTVIESGLLFRKVTAFDVVLGESTFRLTRSAGKVIAHRVMTVRGITLKTETLSLEAWVTALAEKLSEMASASASAREAFSRIAR